MKYSMYDVVLVNKKINGHIQGGLRPYILIQNNKGNEHAMTTIVMPITSKIKRVEQPTHCILIPNNENNLTKESMILAEQVTTINVNEIVKKIGAIKNVNDRNKIRNCYLANMEVDECDENAS